VGAECVGYEEADNIGLLATFVPVFADLLHQWQLLVDYLGRRTLLEYLHSIQRSFNLLGSLAKQLIIPVPSHKQRRKFHVQRLSGQVVLNLLVEMTFIIGRSKHLVGSRNAIICNFLLLIKSNLGFVLGFIWMMSGSNVVVMLLCLVVGMLDSSSARTFVALEDSVVLASIF